MRVITGDNIHFVAENYVDIVTQIRLTVQSPCQDNHAFMAHIAGHWNALSPHIDLDSNNEELFLESMKNHQIIHIVHGGL